MLEMATLPTGHPPNWVARGGRPQYTVFRSNDVAFLKTPPGYVNFFIPPTPYIFFRNTPLVESQNDFGLRYIFCGAVALLYAFLLYFGPLVIKR